MTLTLTYVQKIAYRNYRARFILNNPYGYAAGAEKPISYEDFIARVFFFKPRDVKQYIFYTAQESTSQAMENFHSLDIEIPYITSKAARKEEFKKCSEIADAYNIFRLRRLVEKTCRG